MKTIKFEKIKTGKKEPELNIPVQAVLTAPDFDSLKKQCEEIMKVEKDAEFDWKALIKAQLKSPEWNRNHPLNDVEAIQLAMDVNNILEDKKMKFEVDDKVADYLCEAVAAIQFNNIGNDFLKYALELKKYFKELKETKGKAAK